MGSSFFSAVFMKRSKRGLRFDDSGVRLRVVAGILEVCRTAST